MEWKTPPTRQNRDWSQIAEELAKNPGKWAFIGRMSWSGAYVQAKRYKLNIRIANRVEGMGDVYLSSGEAI